MSSSALMHPRRTRHGFCLNQSPLLRVVSWSPTTLAQSTSERTENEGHVVTLLSLFVRCGLFLLLVVRASDSFPFTTSLRRFYFLIIWNSLAMEQEMILRDLLSQLERQVEQGKEDQVIICGFCCDPEISLGTRYSYLHHVPSLYLIMIMRFGLTFFSLANLR